MNKTLASVGLAALSASGIPTASAQDYTAPPKPWKISASLRGFYDDNINTVHGPGRQDAFGFELSPGASVNLMNDQTTLALAYKYALRYYDKKPENSTSQYDQNHTFTALLQHSFSERYQLGVQDSFVIGQEPDLLRAQAAISEFQRVPGDNIRNYGTIKFNAQITPLIGAEVGYGNSFYDYHDRGGDAITPSLSGTLDRLEHAVHLDGRWMFSPATVGVVGYQYGQVNYTGDETIGSLLTFGDIKSDTRDNRSHYGYVGVDHRFLPNLSGSVRAGIRHTDYYNDPNNTTDTSPYATASLRYSYAPESTVEAGFSYDRSSTDQLLISGDSFALDQQSAVIYGSVHHRIRPRLYGNVTGQFQNSTFNGGQFDGDSDRYFLLGLNLQYHFGPDLFAEIGYNYDKLDSDVSSRSFDRNRVYIGMTASY